MTGPCDACGSWDECPCGIEDFEQDCIPHYEDDGWTDVTMTAAEQARD